ncbi:MAG: hypothetical protein PSW75_03185 [bacterium]|nr:hypothetical protein [bacterium]MDI1336991.1 hypothetical protein [Lacunisphaera sp.]
MKYFPKLILALAGLLLLAVPAVRAADEPAGPPPGDHPKRERGPGAMMEHAAKELGLTADQEAKWKAIGEQERTAGKALRDDTSVAKEDKRAKMQALNKGFADQRRAVLTADQATKFDEMRAKMREHGPRGDKGQKKEKSE